MRRRIELDVADPGQARFHAIGKRFEQFGINPDPDPEHQLLALAPCLDFFRRELCGRGNKRNLRRNGKIAPDIQNDPRIGAHCDLARFARRQKKRHVNVQNIEQRDDVAASWNDFARFDEPIFDAPVARALENCIGDVCLHLVDLGSGRCDGRVRARDLRFRRLQDCSRRLFRRLIFVELILFQALLLKQLLAPTEDFPREIEFVLPLTNNGNRYIAIRLRS